MKRIHEVWVISCMDFTMVGGGQEPYLDLYVFRIEI